MVDFDRLDNRRKSEEKLESTWYFMVDVNLSQPTKLINYIAVPKRTE